MSEIRDKLGENLEKVTSEWVAWWKDQRFNFSRMRYLTPPFFKSRVPQHMQAAGYPDNNEFFHLVYLATLSTITNNLPRNSAYFYAILIPLELVGATDLVNIFD